MEETNEGDESQLLNTRFSQRFNDENNDNDRDYANMQNRPSNVNNIDDQQDEEEIVQNTVVVNN